MIKKYKEFLESNIGHTKKKMEDNESLLKESISIEDIEDQFLRLKEVLNYTIIPKFKWQLCDPYYEVMIAPLISYRSGKAYEELNQIIYRMKIMYPAISIVFYPEHHKHEGIWGVHIKLKNNIS